MTQDKAPAPEREALAAECKEQAQVFASAWSLVGGRFDFGNSVIEAVLVNDTRRFNAYPESPDADRASSAAPAGLSEMNAVQGHQAGRCVQGARTDGEDAS